MSYELIEKFGITIVSLIALGIFSAWLIRYVLKRNVKREEKYQQIIEKNEKEYKKIIQDNYNLLICGFKEIRDLLRFIQEEDKFAHRMQKEEHHSMAKSYNNLNEKIISIQERLK